MPGVTRSTSAVLAAIDGALRDSSVSDDAMRWAPAEAAPLPPQPARVVLPPQAARIIVTLDTAAFERGMQSVARAIAEICGDVSAALAEPFRAAGRAISDTGRYLERPAIHRALLSGDRAHRIRCATCNPAGNPPPLPGGREYHRRQLARQRRRRQRR